MKLMYVIKCTNKYTGFTDQSKPMDYAKAVTIAMKSNEGDKDSYYEVIAVEVEEATKQ